MTKELKQWLDDNTSIITDYCDAYWYRNEAGQATIGYDMHGNPYIAIIDRDGESIYTDNMSYCDHGWSYGADSGETRDWLLSRLPQDLADKVRAEDDVCDNLATDMQEYLRDRNGWDFDNDYFESACGGRESMTDEDIVDKLGIPHDADRDECEDGEDDND